MTDTRTPAHNPDGSLQNWGRNLGTVGPALEEVGNVHASARAVHAQATAALQKLAEQAEDDLPVSPVLRAEVSGISSEMRKLDAEYEGLQQRAKVLRTRAEALPGTYKREHETDEDRLAGLRASRTREKKADVTAAEQDT
jgi:chromosome segregation ATPase